MLTKKPPHTILLVDDDPLLLELGGELLGHLGYAVQTAADAYRALEAFQRLAAVDLVILDYQLPGMDGLQLLQELRRRDAGVRVLVASGFLSAQEAARLERSGVQGIIYKPYRLAELQQRIQGVLPPGPGD